MRIRPRHRHTALGGKKQCIRLTTGRGGGGGGGGALGQVSYGGGGGGGVQLRGPNPYPILGKAGLQKHTLF